MYRAKMKPAASGANASQSLSSGLFDRMSKLMPRASFILRPRRASGRVSCGIAVALVLLAAALGAPSASAKSTNPRVKMTLTCEAVTFAYRNFPNLPGNDSNERVRLDGLNIWRKHWSFDGSTGSHTVYYPLSLGQRSRKSNRVEAAAAWKGNGVNGESITANKEVKCPPKAASFTIEKLQEFEGGPSYTKTELTGEVGETVDYEIVVKNTGNVRLKFGDLVDAKCEGIMPSGEVEVPAGGEQVYTCTHKLTGLGEYSNEASIAGNEGTGTEKSNQVLVDVPAKPAFTIEKQQRIKGEPFYTTSELTASVGHTVEYQITVKNTGNVPLKFGELEDPACEKVTPKGEVEVVPGGQQIYTCSHILTATGPYTNEASITGTPPAGEGFPIMHTSNEVVVNGAEAAFVINKRQRVEGEASYTTSELTAKVGQKVEYEIVVRNTGSVALKFAKLVDASCEGISPAGEVTLAAGGEQVYTCSHKLSSIGKYANTASIEGNEGTGKKTSNEVVVDAQTASFTIEKRQRVEGVGSYTTAELTAEVGDTVEYAVIVKNTGSAALKFGNLVDPACEAVSPAGEVEVAGGGEQVYTCSHTLSSTGKYANTASIEGNEGTGNKTSNEVVVNVQIASFTIEKKQRVEGEASYTTSELTAKVGQKVEYEVIVKNTGTVALKFGKLIDANCEGISPSGEVEVAAGGEQVYTCSHKLSSTGKYGNAASIEGSEGTGKQSSNEVVVNAQKAAFTIEKKQRVEGEASYTTSELAAKVGQKVEYEVIVKNTGMVALKFGKLVDANCEGISPSGEVEVAAGGEQVYTCSHKLSSTGKYGNAASIEGNEGTGKQSSNEVLVNAEKASFSIEKRQRVEGAGSYTTSELSANVGQTVEYEVIVKNTGTVALKFGKLVDANCEGISPSGEVEVAAGGEQVYTCSHKLSTTGKYTNGASIEGGEGTGKQSSNEVVVDVQKASFTIEKKQRVEGAGSYTTSELSAKVGQTVEYEVIVKNTGTVALKFGKLADANCEGISPAGEVTLAAGGEQVYTCSHKLSSTGKYGNAASIEGSEGTGKQTSNEVVVNVQKASFSIEKRQRVEGAGSYTTSELTAKVGQTVEYEVVVKNTGTVALKFGKLVDANCEGISPSGEVEVAAGGEQMYTCSHKLSSTGKYGNAASIEGNEGTGKQSSNEVVVNATEPATCPAGSPGGAIESNFNGTKVTPGEWIWFNSVFKAHNPKVGTTIKFVNQKITIKLQSGEILTTSVPNATITYFAAAHAGEGSTEFNGTEWITRVPVLGGKAFEDNVFFSGLSYQIPAGKQIASAEPVTWEGDITLPAGVELQWQWAAAVYSTLPGDYNELEVKPLHSSSEDKFHNGDQAGTPENPSVQKDHTEGARGGGGSNYTGSYSGTRMCPDPPGEPGTEGNPYSAVEEEPVWLPWPPG
jgi:uncharacterized repeat protein (TIGR01451 family)